MTSRWLAPSRAAALLVALLAACSPSEAPPTPAAASGPSATTTSSAPAPRPAPPPYHAAIDALFRGFEAKLPSPATLSEGNGVSIDCRGGHHATLTLLTATAHKVKVDGAVDLVAVVPWARHPDPCIRQIALEVLLPNIGHDSARLAVPSMYEIDHVQYHDIFVSLASHLEREKVAFDPAIFDGMMLSIRAGDFASYAAGRWVEAAERGKNFRYFVEIDAATVRVTHAHAAPDPDATDHTWTTTVADVSLDARRRWIVSGASAVASSTKGYVGERGPAPFTYQFWPVSPDVMWFRDSPTDDWDRLERQPAR